MTVQVSVPGGTDLQLQHLLLDVNGTLTDRGQLIDGLAERIQRVRDLLEVRLLSADTFGTLDRLGQELGVGCDRVSSGVDKVAIATQLGAPTCAAIGNGTNDSLMLSTVGLGIAVIGPEGASPRTLVSADVVTTNAAAAFDLLLRPQVLTATLRP